jgi:hypothetical protein
MSSGANGAKGRRAAPAAGDYGDELAALNGFDANGKLNRRDELDDASPDAAAPPPRKKQKRNKPTLSCEECVERKTKVWFALCFHSQYYCTKPICFFVRFPIPHCSRLS